MPLTEEFKHFDDVVDDIMHTLAASSAVQQIAVARALHLKNAEGPRLLAEIRELISGPNFPAKQLAGLASSIMLPKYHYQGDSVFSVLHVDGLRFQELLAERDLDGATARYLDIAKSQGQSSKSVTEEQARQIVLALMPG